VDPQLSAEEKIGPQSTVEILDQGTGSDRLGLQFGDRFADLMEPAAQLMTEHGFLLPATGIAVTPGAHLEHPTQQLGRALKFGCEQSQVVVEFLCKSQELLPSVLERPMDRFEPMRA
jgi:hypothetical protein